MLTTPRDARTRNKLMSTRRRPVLATTRLLTAAASSFSTAAASSCLSAARPARRCAVEVAAALLPHPAKASSGGEDAYFVSQGTFGVFDGVGGWVSKGIDAGHFSRALATRTAAYLEERTDMELAVALDEGLSEVLEQGILGSCTACVARIDEHEGVLHALNVGDSGLRVYRPSAPSDGGKSGGPLQLLLATRSQQHYFNCPLQLGGGSTDRPHHGDVYTLAVEPGDLVIMATDGLLDNLFDTEIARIITHGHEDASAPQGTVGPGPPRSAKELAELVAVRARRASLQSKRVTPFSVAAKAEGYSMPGGKLDDVTVICVKVAPVAAGGGGALRSKL